MKRGVTRWVALSILILGWSATARPTPPRLDPGDGINVAGAPAVTAWSMDLLIEPGAQAPFRPMLGTYKLSVQTGEVTLIVNDVAEVVESGDTRLVPAGLDFRLVNRGARPASLRIDLSFAALDTPRWYPALSQA